MTSLPPPSSSSSTRDILFGTNIDPVTVEPPLPLISEVTSLLQRHGDLLSTGGGQCDDDDKFIMSCVHNVSPVLQRGRPMCGLVALSMANTIMTNSTNDSIDPLSLLEYSISNGYSNHGEILSSEHLLTIAKNTLHCTGQVIHCRELTPLAIVNWLVERKAILVPYDCDKDHTPYLASGHSAHWCVIVGVACVLPKSLPPLERHDNTSSGHLFLSPNDPQMKELLQNDQFNEANREHSLLSFSVYCRQGKSKYISLWSLNDLIDSCDNLFELGPQRDSQNYVLSEGNLKECLCSKVVLLQM